MDELHCIIYIVNILVSYIVHDKIAIEMTLYLGTETAHSSFTKYYAIRNKF